MLYNFSHFVASTLMRIIFRLEVEGLENVPAEGPLVLCSNHASFLDPPVIGVAMRHRQIWFMARETLFKNPLFGGLIRALHAFPIRRGILDREAFDQFENLVTAGRAVLIFPEGTRSRDGNLQPAKTGTGMLIYRCQRAKVVPVRLRGTDKALPKGGWSMRPARLRISFGPPVDFSAEWALPAEKETYKRIAGRVMEAISAL